MKFYKAKDIKEITGLGTTATYDLIKKLQSDFKKEYPNSIILRAKIPKWYFDLKIRPESGGEKCEKEKVEC